LVYFCPSIIWWQFGIFSPFWYIFPVLVHLVCQERSGIPGSSFAVVPINYWSSSRHSTFDTLVISDSNSSSVTHEIWVINFVSSCMHCDYKYIDTWYFDTWYIDTTLILDTNTLILRAWHTRFESLILYHHVCIAIKNTLILGYLFQNEFLIKPLSTVEKLK
jgi:hypothetical protein